MKPKHVVQHNHLIVVFEKDGKWYCVAYCFSPRLQKWVEIDFTCLDPISPYSLRETEFLEIAQCSIAMDDFQEGFPTIPASLFVEDYCYWRDLV